jgi:Tfp pilus tip-associated adhesin PilY1
MYTDTAADCSTGPYYLNNQVSGYTYACQACNTVCSISDNSSNYPLYGDPNCSVAFYSNTNTTGYTTNCSKIQIAKRAIFSLMNATNSGTLTSTDINSLGVRLGYMNYYNCQSASDASIYSYPAGSSSSCIQLQWPLTASDNVTTTPYSNVYCNNSTSCLSTNTSSCTTSSPQKQCVAGATPSGGTPLGPALQQGTKYLSYQKTLDPSQACRQKSLILITDGADTFSCPNQGSNPEPGQSGTCGQGSVTCDAQRRSPVYYAAAAKALGFQVFVVGFGSSMPVIDQNTLNWTAYFGGTRNPNTTQSGSVTGVTVGTDPCANGIDPGAFTYNNSVVTLTHPLTGYAFIASNTADLVSAMQAAIAAIQQGEYSFSAEAAIATARISSENFIYEASFNPQNTQGNAKEPFWTGHLKKYAINPSTGQITNVPEWDAGAVLMNTAYTSRRMWTLKNGTMTRFNTTNITDADLGTGTSTSTCTAQTGTCITGCACGAVVEFYRGNPAYNLEQWKLGDLYHTNPVLVQTPSQYFYDPRECPVSGSSSYASFYASNQRSSAAGNQLIIAGGNDGQLHAFTTGNGSDPAAGGNEAWSFIPPNFLQKIAPIAHDDHSNRKILNSHDFFVDGPLQEADAVWLPSSAGSGVTKNAADWRSILILEEGQGSGNFLWSSSSNCYVPYTTTSTGFSATYDPTNYPYYCGLYALDITNTSSTQPTYLWHLNPTSAQAPYLGQAWSRMQIGRVKISGNEKWVGFIGGGFDGTSCTPAGGGAVSEACNTVATGSSGKSFNVVDLTNGQILWQFTYGSTTTSTTSPYMTFDLAGAPTTFDMDGDGFVDTAYIGDLGGNIWRFRFCTSDPLCSSCGLTSYTASPSCTSSSYPVSSTHSPLSYGTCGTSSWKGSLFFQSTDAERGSGLATPANTHKQIFTQPQAGIDYNGNWWIFWGTGESNDPTFELSTDTSTTKNRLYAVTEANLANLEKTGTAYPTFTTAGTNTNTYPLQNITTQAFSPGTANSGWYYNLSTNTLTRSDGTTITNPVGEKMISDPVVFGVVYFTTYVPAQGTATACGQSGDSFLYALDFLTGAGALNNKYLSPGISSSVLVSISPIGCGDGYTSNSNLSYGPGNHINTDMPSSRTNILYWKDQRLNQ